MPSLDTLLAFLGISVLVTLAPGPDNLMVIGQSLAHGRRAGLAFGMGCAAGCLTHIAWATLGIAAVVLVYSNRGQAMPWANTHHEHAIRTLIIGYALWMLASVLILINGALMIVTLYLQIAIAIWAVVRGVIALVLGMMRKAVPHPNGWLI